MSARSYRWPGQPRQRADAAQYHMPLSAPGCCALLSAHPRTPAPRATNAPCSAARLVRPFTEETGYDIALLQLDPETVSGKNELVALPTYVREWTGGALACCIPVVRCASRA